MVFSVLFIFSFALVIASTHTDSLSHIGLSMNSSNISLSHPDCKDICGKEYDNFCLERWKHLPQTQHRTIQIILSVLFGLSILEWILESCTDFMPYTQFYKESESDSDPKDAERPRSLEDSKSEENKISENVEDGIPLQILQNVDQGNPSEDQPSQSPALVHETV